MNDTVKRLLALADEYANTYRWAGDASANIKRQSLEAELRKLFTPLSDEQIAKAWSVGEHNDYAKEVPCMWQRVVEKTGGNYENT